MRTFAIAIRKQNDCRHKIGIWCNGNTTDSGPVIPGSNPGSPTQHTDKNPLKSQVLVGFLLLIPRHYEKNRHLFGDHFGDMACFFPSVFSFG